MLCINKIEVLTLVLMAGDMICPGFFIYFFTNDHSQICIPPPQKKNFFVSALPLELEVLLSIYL